MTDLTELEWQRSTKVPIVPILTIIIVGHLRSLERLGVLALSGIVQTVNELGKVAGFGRDGREYEKEGADATEVTPAPS